MGVPPYLQYLYIMRSGGGNAAEQAYIDRVQADGGKIVKIGCVPDAVWNRPTFQGLLNLYPGAAAAYSVRQLSTSATLSIRVRRSSDNAEQDIGFVSNELDTASLLSFVGAGDGFVVTWYDQANSNNATQSAAANQPKIVDSGSVVTFDSATAIEFNGSSTELEASIALNTTEFSSFAVTGTDGLAGSNAQGIYGSDATAFYSQIRSFDLETRISNPPILTLDDDVGNNPNQMQLFTSINGATEGNQYIDGNLGNRSPLNTSTSGGINETSVFIGSINGQRYLGGAVSELIVYDSDQSSNRLGIEGNINDFFFDVAAIWDDTDIWDDTETWTE